ncbi:programmed cell death protein 2-like [Branchiostoma floridae]|uniref:Programmed cell death protein 2-like n=1 Tax=Branchiostoma floridae TaxID=7739 RepID=A0A9J7LM26_BRAFL|nr:programmed cell death protein 2-like [Branchiostoma floridae]
MAEGAREEKASSVDLGFVEETDSWRLLSRFFPSKVGGKPAWLALKSVPTACELDCGVCGKPTVFLLQVYSPRTDQTTCFHRTVFVFCCRNPPCHARNSATPFRVYRSQLPRQNDFYDFEPPDEDTPSSEAEVLQAEKEYNLCCVCGCGGAKACSRCHQVRYCSKEHQVLDWRAGHKAACGAEDGILPMARVQLLFPEFDLVTEPEEWEEGEGDGEDAGEDKEEKLREYEDYMRQLRHNQDRAGGSDLQEKDLEAAARQETEEDQQFSVFRRRVRKEPEQVLRYDLGGAPLWVSRQHIPTAEDIPDCTCGAPRQLEFQVMPQLLNYLQVDSLKDSIDWGTLAVYTCVNSCEQGTAYHPEFLWKQDYSETALTGAP